MALDGFIEDLDSMRRRIRDEARLRREIELRRRRDAAERRRRGVDDFDSDSSDDLLRASPSPTPPAIATGAVASNDSTSIMGTMLTTDKSARPPCEKKLSIATHEMKNPKDSEAESRLVAWNTLRGNTIHLKDQKSPITNNQAMKNCMTRWSDDDSEDEMDIREVVARRNAEKRKRELYEAQSSIQVEAKVSTQSVVESFQSSTVGAGDVAPGNYIALVVANVNNDMDCDSLKRQDRTRPTSLQDDAPTPSDNADIAPVCSMKSMHQSPNVIDNPKHGHKQTEAICLLSSDESGDESGPKRKVGVPEGSGRSRERDFASTATASNETMAQRLQLEEQQAYTHAKAASEFACVGVKKPHNHASLRDRVGTDRRIRWDGMSETLEEWLNAVSPSKVSLQVADWIQVENFSCVSCQDGGNFNEKHYQHELYKMSDLIMRTRRVPAVAKQACSQSILSVAKKQRYTTGKWMIFFPPDKVDEGWKTIAVATAQGQLGCSSKVSPVLDNPERAMLCCIYVSDFADRAEVRRVLLALRQLGMEIKCGFKPDVFTMLGINSGNEWRLKPTIYTVGEASEWSADVGRATY